MIDAKRRDRGMAGKGGGAAPFVLPDCSAGDARASLARRISASAVLVPNTHSRAFLVPFHLMQGG
jgi:hypothetical protein